MVDQKKGYAKPLWQNQDTDFREWYFVFTPSDNLNLFYKFICWLARCPKNQAHVLAFCQQGPFLFFIEPTKDRIEFITKWDDVDGKPMLACDAAQVMKDYGYTVYRHKFKSTTNSWRFITSIIPNCLSVVKVCTGLPCLALTSRGLIKFLRDNGAQEI